MIGYSLILCTVTGAERQDNILIFVCNILVSSTFYDKFYMSLIKNSQKAMVNHSVKYLDRIKY